MDENKIDENTEDEKQLSPPPIGLVPRIESEARLRLRTYQREYMRKYRAKLRELNPKPPKPPKPEKVKKPKKPPPPPKPKRIKKTPEELYQTQLDRQNKKVTCCCGAVVSHGNLRVHITKSLKHKKLMAKLENEPTQILL